MSEQQQSKKKGEQAKRKLLMIFDTLQHIYGAYNIPARLLTAWIIEKKLFFSFLALRVLLSRHIEE